MAKKNILLVEDEETIATTLGDRLKFDGYNVVVATDGKEGIEKARGGNPDLVILDIMLPDMSGHDVCRAIKENSRTTPVLMVTSKIDAVDPAKARESGADSFDVKTTGYAPLCNAVKEIFG